MRIIIAFWYGSCCEYLHFFPIQLYVAGGFTVAPRHDLSDLKSFVTYSRKIRSLNAEGFQWIVYSGNVTTFLLNLSVNNDFRIIFALHCCSNNYCFKKILSYTFSLRWMKTVFNGWDKFTFALWFSVLIPKGISMSVIKLVIECRNRS